jgi:sulfite reductase (NADPH) flavoprotein alpha-component
MNDRGWRQRMPNVMINRQSTQAFFAWDEQLGNPIGQPLALDHQVQQPPTERLKLVSRGVLGTEVQAPTAILRFQAMGPKSNSVWQRLVRSLGTGSQFSPGALPGVVAHNSVVPQYYSIASAASYFEVEICVRKIPGGACSGLLHDLAIGDEILGFAKPNPDFDPVPGKRPIIMIAAGMGIAPLVGAIRSNTRQRPVHLFFGARDPESDFLYRDTLADSLQAGRMATLSIEFSRVRGGAYVQDNVRTETARLAALLRQGASIMVCGGDAMARAVCVEFDTILSASGLSVDQMKTRGQYLEDIF